MKIIADTATLFSPQDGENLGITVVPVSVAVDGKAYKDYQEITSDEFIKLVEQGSVPTSSQPSVGEIIEVLEKSDEETVFITVGDGLSGAYQTAVGAKNCIENSENIHIINS
ncbi:MAG: DegV family protein, partial [Oscillospiraceae bacterium]|nr:DegV family protein [Oscillospiraceae bacterium]